MSLKHLMQRITSTNGIDIPDSAHVRVPAGEIRAARAEADALRRERDDLAERLAEIERAEPVAWIERITGRLAAPTDEHRTRFPMVYSPLIDRPVPAAAPELAEVRRLTAEADALRRERDDLAARLAEIEAQKPVAFFRLSDAEWLAIGRPAIVYKTADGDWTGPLYSYPAPAAAPERAEPSDGCGACGCDQAKSGRCVMGDYGALPIGTQLYAGAAPEQAERLSEIERWKRIAENAQAVTTGGDDPDEATSPGV